MLRLILARLLQLPLILAVVLTITFTLTWILPGSPLEQPDGRRPPPAVVEALERQYNLHSPWAFLGGYLRGLFLGSAHHPAPDFGPSLAYQDRRVGELLSEGLPISALLGTTALVLALVLGTTAGVLGALKPGTLLDRGSLLAVLLGVSLPNFVTGSLLLAIFAGLTRRYSDLSWLWFPVNGWGTARHLVLPALTLAVAPAAYIARLIRLGLAEIMAQDFIRTARAKGLSHHQTLFRHALKVAYLPVLSFLGPAAATTLTGSFVVEKVFGIPGMGVHFVNAVLNKDQFLILGVVLTFASILVLFNLLVDIAYAWLDPRIELS